MRALATAAVFALAALAACGVPTHGPSMDPGEDCVGCHNAGEGPDFTAAGTVYTNLTDHADAGVKGATVELVDANGRTLTLKSQEVGNFYTREKLVMPLARVTIRKGGFVATMEDVPTGACNDCHTQTGRTSSNPSAIARGAPLGRVALVMPGEDMAPGEDCQQCHVAGGVASAKPFALSGTVFASRSGGAGVAGVDVIVTDANGVRHHPAKLSTQSGNFWFDASQPIVFPVTVEIVKGTERQSMGDERIPTPQSCNGCHRPGGEGEGRVSTSRGDD